MIVFFAIPGFCKRFDRLCSEKLSLEERQKNFRSISVYCSLEENEWNGRKNVQLKLGDMGFDE